MVNSSIGLIPPEFVLITPPKREPPNGVISMLRLGWVELHCALALDAPHAARIRIIRTIFTECMGLPFENLMIQIRGVRQKTWAPSSLEHLGRRIVAKPLPKHAHEAR